MAVKPKGPQTVSEAFRLLGEQVTNLATRPNMHGYEPHYKQNPFHSHGRLLPPKGHTGIFRETGLPEGRRLWLKEQLTKIRLYIGGNRSGKTVGGIIEDIWWVTKKHPYIDIDAIWPEPIRGRIVTTDFINGWDKIIRPELARWIPLSELRGSSWTTAYDKETHVLHFDNGGFIEIMTHEQDLEKFAGASRHFVHFDEECSKDIYNECIARLVDTGGCAWMTETPVDGMTWVFDTLYEPGLEGDLQILVVEVDMYDNPFVSDAEKDNLTALYGGSGTDDVNARIHGKFVRKGGLIYPDFSETVHVIEPDIPSKDYLWAVSMDHGLKNPSSWHWHAVNYEGRVYTFEEHYQRNWVISQHAAKVHEINKKLGREPDYYVGDPSIRNRMPNTGVSVFEEYVKYGIIIQHQDYLNDFKPGVERVTRYLRTVDREFDGTEVPYWLITRNCTNLIWEIKRYRWRTFINRRSEDNNNPPELPVKKDDHACDECRYFFMSRVDLRQITIEKKDPWEDAERLVNATPVYPVGDSRRNLDRELVSHSDPNGWVVDGDTKVQDWQIEESLGADW
jgi:phage terminase large subunit-like protein